MKRYKVSFYIHLDVFCEIRLDVQAHTETGAITAAASRLGRITNVEPDKLRFAALEELP